MSKKLITACLGLLALAAFILPATASASPQITHPTGTRLDPTGKTCTTGLSGICITATQLGVSKFTNGAGEVLTECSSASMTGALQTNSGTLVTGTIHSTTFSGTAAEGKCTKLGGVRVTTNVGANGTPWCVRADNTMNADEFQVRGGACSEESRPITFTMDTGLGVSCGYSRTAAIKGTFTTDSTGDAILSLTGGGATGSEDTEFSREAGESILCPAAGRLDMEFTLETDTTASNDPLYIS